MDACIAQARELTASGEALHDITLSIAETTYSEQGGLPPTLVGISFISSGISRLLLGFAIRVVEPTETSPI